MRWFRILAVAVVVMFGASGAFAMFRAADLVVIPTAASTSGLNNSHWHTDLEIMNVDTVAVDVQIVFLQCCGSDNVAWFQDVKNSLGGDRAEDGFGHVDKNLNNIQPGQTVTLNDVVFANWGADLKGALLVFAYQAGTLMTTTPPGGTPKLILAQARTYSQDTNSDGKTTTYGSQVPGLPWHDYIDPAQKTNGLDKGVFIGLREDASYRSSIGLINISDRLTTLNVQLTLNAADGTTQIAQQSVQLAPLAVEQFDQAIVSLFAKTVDDAIAGASLTVTVPLYVSGAQTPAPGVMVFVTRMDNITNDPVYLEQAFTGAFPWDCVFNGNCPPKFTAQGLGVGAVSRTHLRPPTRSLGK